MRPVTMALVLLLTLGAAWASPSSGPLERHIQHLQARISAERQRFGEHPFVHQDGRGRIVESYVVTPQSYTYTRYDADGAPAEQWTERRSTPRSALYEAWYGPKRSKERLQVDDRTVEYTSWWKNGQKWEEYTFNVPKNEKAYYVYDENGHLYP